MKLSVIIVNYNVKYFLEQCLNSVRKAARHVATEVWVVDNNSVDQSLEMVREKFPEVRLIANKENLGFSAANNQAIEKANGTYILLLNPDTLVEETTFKKVVEFMDSQSDAGGLGVKMVDGNGRFLPESKRGMPTPLVAFFKLVGLSSVFPKSKIFGRYHLGYLNKDKVHSVDVLSGAFMLIRKTTLDKIGLLDETFFMYGEDIDLSYRIIKGGYKNYYFPKTRIIHYKGESTKKSSVNYVFTFYKAMVIFARKHFSIRYARLFSFLINIAIYFRASLSIVKRLFNRIYLPLTDAFILYVGFYFIKNYWEQKWLEPDGGSYPLLYMLYIVPVYILVLLAGVLMSGGYDKPYNISKLVRGLFFGIISILVMYALLPENYRYSRAIILAGTFWGFISLSGVRYGFKLAGIKSFKATKTNDIRIAIVGSVAETQRVANLYRSMPQKPSFIGLVSLQSTDAEHNGIVGNIDQLGEIIGVYSIDEVVFCAKDIEAQTIIDYMIRLSSGKVKYKIAPEKSIAIIGSNSISAAEDMFMIDVDNISKPINRRNKRLLDIVLSFMLLFSLILNIWFVERKKQYILNIFRVIFCQKTWVGYYNPIQKDLSSLPYIKKGVLHPGIALSNNKADKETLFRLNLLYSRNYKLKTDLQIIWKGFKYLGN